MSIEWKETELGKIAFTTSGGTPSRKNENYYSGGTIPWVKSGELEFGTITKTEEFITQAGIDNSSAKIFPKGTLLIALYGATIGKLSFLGIDAATNQAVCGIFENDTVDLKYLYYFLLFQRPNLVRQGIGGAQPNISQTILKKLMVPYPKEKSEQERIVAKIEELFSKLDNGVETLKKTKQQLAVYRQAVLKESFGEIKEYIPLGKITVSRLGKMLDKEKNTGILQPYLRNINVRWFSFDLSDLLEMRIEPEENEKYSVTKGDLIICEGGEPGRCAIWEQDETIFYQKALHRVRFTDDSNPKFYMYYFWFAAQTGKLNPFFTGMGIKHLTGQSLVKVPVPTARKEEQDLIVQEIESRLSVCDSIEKTVDTALLQAEAMRQSILKKAFEGRL